MYAVARYLLLTVVAVCFDILLYTIYFEYDLLLLSFAINKHTNTHREGQTVRQRKKRNAWN